MPSGKGPGDGRSAEQREHALWRRLVSLELPGLDAPAVERARVTDELAQMLRDEAEVAGVDCVDENEVRAWLGHHRERLGHLGSELRWSRSAPDGAEPGMPAASRINGRRATMTSGLWGDVLAAVRSWRKRPGLAAVVFATLVLGIGLNASVFSILHSVLFRPAPVAESEDLVKIYATLPDGFLPEEPMAYQDIVDLPSTNALVDAAAQAMTFGALSTGERAEVVIAEMVSGNLFEMLGLVPRLGRLIQPSDVDGGDADIAVISARTWERRFDSRPDVIGETVRLNGSPLQIVGVVPSGFTGIARGIEPELWIPIETALRLGLTPSTNSGDISDPVGNRATRSFWAVARKRSELTHEQAAAEIAAFAAALQREFPDSNEDRDFKTVPYDEVKLLPAFDGRIDAVSAVLLGVAFLVLLIAAFNLANLLLARALARRGEMATRLSLGASRGRIVRQLLVESLLLAGVGAAGGLAVAAAVSRAVSLYRIEMIVPIQVSVGLDATVVLFTIAVSTLTAIIFGLAPALEASRTDLASVMKESAGRTGTRRMRFQNAMVVGQVTLSVVLLVFAGLMLRSVRQAGRIDPGFEMEGVAGMTLSPASQGYEADEIRTFYQRLERELESTPGIAEVSMPNQVPLTMTINTWELVPPERAGEDPDTWPDIDFARVDESYFSTLGIPILHGRGFDAQEVENRERVVVINRKLAEMFWGNEPAVGKVLVSNSGSSDTYRVVGVAATGKYRTLGEEDRPFVYLPLGENVSMRTVIARFRSPDQADEQPLLAAVREIDPYLAVSTPGTLAEITSTSMLVPRIAALVFGAFGGIGLLLSAIGLFGVLAYSVSQRTHEIGLRVAVGANTADVLGLVARRGLWMTGVGVVLGLLLALGTTRMVGSLLYGVGATDPVTFVVVPAVLVLTTLVATLGPARRALSVDPTTSLRAE